MAEAMVKITGDSSGAVSALKSTSNEMDKTTASSTKMSGAFGNISKVFSGFSSSISSTLPQLSNLGGSLGSAAGGVTALGGTMTSLTALLNPLGIAVGAATASVVLFAAGLKESFEQLKKTEKGTEALTKMKEATDGMKSAFSSMVAGLASGFGDGIDLAETMTGIMNSLKEAIEKITPLVKLLGSVFNIAFKGIAALLKGIIGYAGALADMLTGMLGLTSEVTTLKKSMDDLNESTKKVTKSTISYAESLALTRGVLLDGVTSNYKATMDKNNESIQEATNRFIELNKEIEEAKKNRSSYSEILKKENELNQLTIKITNLGLENDALNRKLMNQLDINKATKAYNDAVKSGDAEAKKRAEDELRRLLEIKDSLQEVTEADIRRGLQGKSATRVINDSRDEEIKKNKELEESIIKLFKDGNMDEWNKAALEGGHALDFVTESLNSYTNDQLLAIGVTAETIEAIRNNADANMNLAETMEARVRAQELLNEAEEAGVESTLAKAQEDKEAMIARMEGRNQEAELEQKIHEQTIFNAEELKSSLTDLGLDAMVDTFATVGQSIGNLMAGIKEDGANLGDMMKKMAGQVAVSLASILMTTAAAQIAGGNFVGGAAMMAGGIALIAIGTALGAKKPKKETAPPAPVHQQKEQERMESTEYIQRRSPSVSPQGTASGRNWGSEKDEADRYGIDRNRTFQG